MSILTEYDINLTILGTRKFEITSTSVYSSEKLQNAEFYKIKSVELTNELKEKLDKDELRRLAVVKISNTLRKVKTNSVNGINFTLNEELSRDVINKSLVQVYFPQGNEMSWIDWCYDRSDVKSLWQLEKISTSHLKKQMCFHKALEISKSVVKTNRISNWSNDDKEDLNLVEFGDSKFLFGYYYLQSDGTVLFEDFEYNLESFEEHFDEGIKNPVFFYDNQKFGPKSIEKFIRTL